MKQKFTKAILLGAIIYLIANNLFAQSTTPKWAKTWDSDGTGTGYNNGGAQNHGADAGYAVTTDASGNVYATGLASRTVGCYPNADCNSSIEVVKYNASGTLQWKYNINGGYCCGGSQDHENGYCISVDGSGNVWVAASYYNGTTYNDDLALFKFNSSGTLQSGYPKTENDASGGYTLQGICLAVYDATHVYIGGTTYNGTTWKGIVHKDNASGSGWDPNFTTYTFNGSSNTGGYSSAATDLKADANYVYVTGYESNTSQGYDVFTSKLSASTGAAQSGWPVTYNNSSNNLDDAANALAVDPVGNVYVAGYSKASGQGKNTLLIKYNNSGALQSGFPVIYNGSANGDDSWSDIAIKYAGAAATDIFVGGYANRGSSTYTDYAIADNNSSGGYVWGPVFYDGGGSTEAAGTDQGYGLEYASTSGRVYISGMSTELVGGNNTINLTTVGYNASTGSKVWGAASYDYGTDQILADDEMFWKYGLAPIIYNSGYCVDEIYVEGVSYVQNESWDYITLKYSCGTCYACRIGNIGNNEQSENTAESNFGLYPNPFAVNALLILSPETVVHNAVLSVYDITGRMVSSIQNIVSNTIVIDRGNLKNGLYFYKFSENGNILSNGKFVIAD